MARFLGDPYDVNKIMWKLYTVELSQCKYNYVICNFVSKESASKYISLIFEFVDCLNANNKIVFSM